MSDSYELVRVSRELVERLLQGEDGPVVMVGLERHDDGTCELVFRRVASGWKRERYLYRQALEEIASHPPVERNPDGVDQAAFTMQMIAREALGERIG